MRAASSAVIFASTLLSLPTTILQFVETSGKTISEWWYTIFSYQKPIGFAIYVILIFVFAFFYSFMQIDPDKMADNFIKVMQEFAEKDLKAPNAFKIIEVPFEEL